MNSNRNRIPLPQFVYIIILSVAMMAKASLFYSDMRLLSFDIPLAAATGAIFLLIYTAVMLFSPKAAMITSTAIYWIFSFVMGIDSVYYTYMSKLPSAALLGMVGQLDDVASTIEQLITLNDLLMIIDLPVIFLVLVNSRLFASMLERAGTAIHKIQLKKTVSALITLPIVICAGVYIFTFPDFEARYMANEVMCYHAVDTVKTIFGSGHNREVDKTAYTEPDWSDSEFWGLAEGRNVIVIQVEAMQNFVIGRDYEGQEIMPNLNRMIKEDSFYFDQYYYQIGGGNTSDAEFTVNNSLFAPENEAAYVKYTNNNYFGLPHLLKDSGYSGAHVFHAYEPDFWNRRSAYPAQGFDSFMALDDMEQNDMFAMGLSDIEMFRQSMEELKTYEEPFYSFYITLSSHYPYAIPDQYREIVLTEEDTGTLYGFYLQSMNYTDRAIGEFMKMLDEAGLYDNSIIVIYGDHYALTNTDSNNMKRVSALLGRPYSVYDVFSVPLIIHIPGMGTAQTISTAGGHIDVLPTLLPLLGIRNTKSVMFGQNLLEAEEGIVCQQTHLGIGSFISGEVYFSKPQNNIRGNYDAYEYGTMIQLDPYQFEETSEKCAEKIHDCAALLQDNDVLLD